VSDSGISWAICKSAHCSRQTTTPAPTTLFFTGRMPFLPPNEQRQSTEGTTVICCYMSLWSKSRYMACEFCYLSLWIFYEIGHIRKHPPWNSTFFPVNYLFSALPMNPACMPDFIWNCLFSLLTEMPQFWPNFVSQVSYAHPICQSGPNLALWSRSWIHSFICNISSILVYFIVCSDETPNFTTFLTLHPVVVPPSNAETKLNVFA